MNDKVCLHQSFWGLLIDLIIQLLGLIIKPLDHQTKSWNVSIYDLMIKYTNVYSQIQTNQAKDTDSVHMTTTSSGPFLLPTSCLSTVNYLCFLYATSSSVKTPLSWIKSVIWYWFLPSMWFPSSSPYHPFYHVLSNELCAVSSSRFHHQSARENPHQFPQSVRVEDLLSYLLGYLRSYIPRIRESQDTCIVWDCMK